MSTLNAPPPPLPDQLADPVVTATADAPRGDQKTVDAHSTVQAHGEELARRLAGDRAKLEADELAKSQRAAAEQKVAAAQLEKETWEVSRLAVATASANNSAFLTFLGWTAAVAAAVAGLAYALTSSTPTTATTRRSRRGRR